VKEKEGVLEWAAEKGSTAIEVVIGWLGKLLVSSSHSIELEEGHAEL
jgi:hypothetical protein